MKINKNFLIRMNQTHSNRVFEVKSKNLKNKINSDALVTKLNTIALGVVTADCVPILLYDLRNDIVGCIHAGWRGAFSNIIQNTLKLFKKMNSNNIIYASVGPCIGKQSYEVDINFYKKFIKKTKKNKKYFLKKDKNKKLFNLRNFVTDKLLAEGVKVDHVNRDTFKEKNYFYSYRRSTISKQKDYGRCISVIRLI